jgi:anti-sigma-K factor RskA
MTPGNRNHYEDWDLFALGVLDDAEQRDMAAHLASGCDECMQRYISAQALVAGLASLNPDAQLPPGAELRLRKRLESSAAPVGGRDERVPAASVWGIRTLAPWAVAAICLLAAIGFAVGLRDSRKELREHERQSSEYEAQLRRQAPPSPGSASEVTPAQVTELENTIERLKRELAAAHLARVAAEQEVKAVKAQLADAQGRNREMDASLREAEERRSKAEESLASAHLQLAKAQADAGKLAQASAQNDQIIALLESAPLSQLDLKPAGSARASARVFWQNDRGLLLVARDLPSLAQNGSYQLWFYRQGKPDLVNVGVLQLGNSGDGLLFVPPGPALLAMSGALVTAESGSGIASQPGEEILKVKP